MFGLWQWFVAYLAAVRAVPVGLPGDGVDRPLFSSGTEIDKEWSVLLDDIRSSREAWRANPMARRIIGLTTSYVIGAGMSVASEHEPLKRFIERFWDHPQNRMALRLEDWSDELARAGELFVALFPNAGDGMSYVRVVPASRIEEIQWKDGDYETELAYRETTEIGRDERWWLSPAGDAVGYKPRAGSMAAAVVGDDGARPWMMHYAINRPVGAIRGEGDLAPLLVWLRRYNRWLEDRVRLNAAVRAFLWVVSAPRRAVADLKDRYKDAPEPGTVIVAEEDEKWSAVTPTLNARDASADGRAIRWMIAAGGPGTSLIDFGEGEDANLATAKASGELRRRFLLRRQAYFAWMLSEIIATAYNRQTDMYARHRKAVNAADVLVIKPDISVEDNGVVAKAAMDLVKGLLDLRQLLGDSQALRRYGLRLFVRYSGESVTEQEFERLLTAAVTPPVDGGKEPDDGKE